VTFNGTTGVLSGLPTTAATFNISFTATNTAGSATQSFMLTVNKGTAAVTLSNLTQTYTGSPLTPTLTTTPSGLATTLTGAPDTNAGTYAVAATVNDSNYAGSAIGSFVINKAAATLALSNLAQTYDGTAKTATVATTPAGLAVVSVTYSGSATPPVNVGSYAVVASLSNANYTATNASGTLVVNKASATVTANAASKTYGLADPA